MGMLQILLFIGNYWELLGKRNIRGQKFAGQLILLMYMPSELYQELIRG